LIHLNPVKILMLVLLLSSQCNGLQIERYFAGPDEIASIDYKDGTLALGTNAGLVIYRDGQIMLFDEGDGLLGNRIWGVFLQDGVEMYVGPFEKRDGMHFQRAVISDETIRTYEITSDEPLVWCGDRMVSVAPDGSLWVGDAIGLRHYSGESWETYQWPEDILYNWAGVLQTDDAGNVWGATDHPCCGDVFRFDGLTWELYPEVSGSRAMGIDPNGAIWSVSRRASELWRHDGGGWQLISDDEAWSSDALDCPGRIEFDEYRNLWIADCDRILIWDGQDVIELREACGLEFRCKASYAKDFLWSIGSVDSSLILIGTAGSGLLISDGDVLSRFALTGRIPGDHVRSISLASDGAVWVDDNVSLVFGKYRNRSWDEVIAPWMHTVLQTHSGADIDGSLWFSAESGAAQLAGQEFNLYGSANSGLTQADVILVASNGLKWFSQRYNDCPVVSYDGAEWTTHDWADYLPGGVRDMALDADNHLWMISQEGCAEFDGEDLVCFVFGRELPECLDRFGMCHISFGLDHRPILFSRRGVWTGDIGGEWIKVCHHPSKALQYDVDGTYWLGAYEGLIYGTPNEWKQYSCCNGLSDNHVVSIMIDHNGDKWVGTEHGLNRIQDGGPAQQKLELSADVTPDGYLTVSGTFTNAGAVIPVLLWLACEHDGTFYYYPTWGPTPQGVKRVLSAYSIETEPLLRLDTSTLPPGDYTFYGGISLLGGMDLLIGARGAKVAVATYHKQ